MMRYTISSTGFIPGYIGQQKHHPSFLLRAETEVEKIELYIQELQKASDIISTEHSMSSAKLKLLEE